MKAADYWREVGAPKLRARKAEIGRSMTNTDIADVVEGMSGKRTTRPLLEAFFKGEREPYISQLVAICDVMKMDLMSLVAPPTAMRRPAFRVQEGRQVGALPHKRGKSRTAG